MALPVAASTWKYAKYLVRAAGEAIPFGLAYLEGQLDDGNEEADVTWMRWHCIATRTTPAGTVEDKAQFKLDFLNITSGAIDSTWTTSDFTALQAPMDAMLTTLKPYAASSLTYSEHVVYKMRFNPDDPGPGPGPRSTSRPFLDTGPPVYRATISLAGTGAAIPPYQLAATVTFRTAWPRHWGRVYLPSWGVALSANGRFSSGQQTAVTGAFRTMAGATADLGFLHVTPVQQLNKDPFHALLGVNQYAMDDIPDVIRRRRPKQVALRTVV